MKQVMQEIIAPIIAITSRPFDYKIALHGWQLA
jgi:hypothetical protein